MYCIADVYLYHTLLYYSHSLLSILKSFVWFMGKIHKDQGALNQNQYTKICAAYHLIRSYLIDFMFYILIYMVA